MLEINDKAVALIERICLSVLGIVFAICLMLTLDAETAFAQVAQDFHDETSELADSDFVHITGGTSFYDAATLPVNKTNSFTVSGNGRYYYYKFTLSSDGYISIPSKFCDEQNTADDIYIYNSSQEKIWDCGYSSYVNSKFGLSKGTYYLSFEQYHNRYSNPATFQMRLNFTSSNVWEKEANDSFEFANTVPLNTVIFGTGVNQSKDYFKFTLPNKMRVRVAVKNTTNIGVCVYANDMSEIVDWWQYTQSGLTVDDVADVMLEKGTYYLGIGSSGLGNQNSSQEYSFKIQTTNVSNVTMHRLYNRWTGEHFYTSNTTEKNDLVKKGWSYEGVGWTAPSESSKPVYRLYNKYAPGGDHHYTIDTDEKDSLVKKGWSDEGVGWYSDPNEGVPLYRQYNRYATTGTHNYTTNKSENDDLVKEGWREEGISWYGVK